MAQDKSTKEAVKVSRVSKTGVKPEKPAAKPEKPSVKATDKRAKAEPPPPPKPSPVERYSVKPEFCDGVFHSMPPWHDEIASILLIVFGIVSFLSLIDVSGDATIAAAWSRALTSLFGWGSVLISAGIFLLGVL